MGWENRGDRQYYYRKRRIGKRVVSEYIGTGELAELIAAFDQLERAEREAEKQAWRQERDADLAVAREVDTLGDAVRGLTQAALVVASCRTHKGTWRRKRG